MKVVLAEQIRNPNPATYPFVLCFEGPGPAVGGSVSGPVSPDTYPAVAVFVPGTLPSSVGSKPHPPAAAEPGAVV